MKKIIYKTNQNNPVIRAYKEAVEKGRKNQHVLPRQNGWVVKNLGSGKASHVFSTKEDAADYAESMAAAGTAVFIHNSEGRIQNRIDH